MKRKFVSLLTLGFLMTLSACGETTGSSAQPVSSGTNSTTSSVTTNSSATENSSVIETSSVEDNSSVTEVSSVEDSTVQESSVEESSIQESSTEESSIEESSPETSSQPSSSPDDSSTSSSSPLVATDYVFEYENATHESPDGSWNSGQITTPVEENAGDDTNPTSGGKSLGYMSTGCKETIAFTSNAAGKATLTFRFAPSSLKSDWSGIAEMDLATTISIKVNGTALDLTGKVLNGVDGWNWYSWQNVSFADVDLQQGDNTVVLEIIGAQGPNIDYIKLVDKNAPQGGDPVTPDPVVEKVTVSFDANGGTGTMAAVEAEKGEYTLPACSFTAPGTKVFGGWEYTVKTEFWGQVYEQQKVGQPGDKVTLSEDITFKAVWNVHIEKTAQADLTSAFVMEAEDAVIAGAQTQQGGSPVETNESSHGGKDVGYMSAGASITFNFNASAAGQVKLILMGRSANADWSNWQNPTYYDHALEETTSIKANDADVDVTGKGFLGSDAKTSVQIDLGNINVKAGANTIVISALKQAPNMDCIALIADGITFTLPQA